MSLHLLGRHPPYLKQRCMYGGTARGAGARTASFTNAVRRGAVTLRPFAIARFRSSKEGRCRPSLLALGHVSIAGGVGDRTSLGVPGGRIRSGKTSMDAHTSFQWPALADVSTCQLPGAHQKRYNRPHRFLNIPASRAAVSLEIKVWSPSL